MSEEAASVQRKTLKELQNAWRTFAQDQFKRLQESLEAKYEESRAGSRFLHRAATFSAKKYYKHEILSLHVEVLEPQNKVQIMQVK